MGQRGHVAGGLVSLSGGGSAPSGRVVNRVGKEREVIGEG
jgi:hypothetical protein